MTIEELERSYKERPHVVILGAGASCATIPNGDKNGRKIPAMKGFLEQLGLTHILDGIELRNESDNLEDIYSELDSRSTTEKECKITKKKLENEIRSVMSTFELPDEPTIYDFLISSLTSKDLIATFNWDPLIVQAIERSSGQDIPDIIFLHGNVAIGYCSKHYEQGCVQETCSKCDNEYEPLPLLFPVQNKRYADNPAIKAAWKKLSRRLRDAYIVTVFGYSAPSTDQEALKIMQQGWGDANHRDQEEMEFVNIGEENSVIEPWKDFIHGHHYSYHTNFFDTILAQYPRRSCEATFDRLLGNHFLDSRGKAFNDGMTWEEIDNLIYPLIESEHRARLTKDVLDNPYKT